MGRFEKVCALANEKGISVQEILINHLKPIDIRTKIAEKMNAVYDDELEPDDLYQLCETPTSQKKLLSYF